MLKNVKGNLDGMVTVNQAGGYDEAKGREVRVEGDEPLEAGREYLFTASRDRKKGWYTVIAQPFGAVPVADQGQRVQAEKRFEQAAEEQIPPDPSGIT